MPSQTLCTRRGASRVAALLTAASLFAVLLAAAALGQDPSPAPLVSGNAGNEKNQRYSLLGTFYLELDGKKIDQARLYHSTGRGAVLVRSPGISTPFQLKPQGRLVEVFAAEDLVEYPDGTVEIPPEAAPVSTGNFTLDAASAPVFTVAGRTGRLVAKPPLLGLNTRASLLSYDPSYGLKATYYQPTPEYLDILRRTSEPVRVRVFLGTWCSVCSELVPHILRVEEKLAGSKISFEYYGLPADYNDPEAKRLDVSQVPTGILYRGDREIARIVQWSWRFPDMALVNSLSAQAPAP